MLEILQIIAIILFILALIVIGSCIIIEEIRK